VKRRADPGHRFPHDGFSHGHVRTPQRTQWLGEGREGTGAAEAEPFSPKPDAATFGVADRRFIRISPGRFSGKTPITEMLSMIKKWPAGSSIGTVDT
jgi:hypothetical protein